MVRVLKDRILCKIREGERFRRGVIIPEFAYDFNKKSDVGTRATVVGVGPWQDEVKPGDEVIVEKLGGVEIQLEGEEFVIFDSHEVLAIVEWDEWCEAGKAIELPEIYPSVDELHSYRIDGLFVANKRLIGLAESEKEMYG